MNSIIQKYKLDWMLLILSVFPLFTLFRRGDILADYDLQSVAIVVSLTLFFAACLLHAFPKIKATIQDRSLDNLIHYGSLLTFAILLGINHLRFHFDVDDLYYQTRFSETPFLQVLSEMYGDTTPCVLIHALVGAFVHLDPIVWRLFDTLVMTLCVEMVLRLFVPKNRMRYAPLFVAFAILIPKATFCNTGWCATTLNYLWPATASMFLYYFLKRFLEGKRLSRFVYAITVPLLLFACNSIQSAVLCFCITLTMTGWMIYQAKSCRKVDSYLYFVLAGAFLSLLFILLCPGNAVRSANEIQAWFPTFNDYNVLQKLHMGFINSCTFFWSTGEWCIMKNHFPFVVLPLGLLLVYRMLKQHKSPRLVISALVILLFLLLPYISFFITRYTPHTFPLLESFQRRMAYEGTQHISETLLPVAGYLFLMECLIIGIYDTFRENRKQALLMILIFLAGICSSLMLSFSPTLYASGERVLLFQAITILMVTIAAYVKSIDDKSLTDKTFIVFCLIIAIIVPVANDMKWKPQYLNPFSELNVHKTEGIEPGGCIFIDIVNDLPVRNQIDIRQIETRNDSILTIRGWAFDGNEKCKLGDIYAKVGSHIIIGEFDETRSDVKTIFGLTDDTLGFHMEIPVKYLTGEQGERREQIEFGLVGKERKYRYEHVLYPIVYAE